MVNRNFLKLLIVLTLGLMFVLFQNFSISPASPLIATEFKARYGNVIYPELLKTKPIGDGVADDTEALQYAIDYAKARTPATLILNKTYKITRQLIIHGAHDLDIGGTGTIHNSGAVLANQVFLNFWSNLTSCKYYKKKISF